MGNRFSFESDSDIVKLVVRLDANHPESLIEKLEKLPLFKSKQQLHDDILFLFSDQFHRFLERDPSDFSAICQEIYQLEKATSKDYHTLEELNISGYRTGFHSEKLYSYVQSFFGEEKVEFKQKRIVNSIFKGLSYFIEHSKPLYVFDQVVPLSHIEKFNFETDLSKTYMGGEEKYPYIFVKIRSGISFYRVTGPGKFQRIAGSIMGESFVESVMLKLTQYKDINAAFKDGFQKGDNRNCDMTVEDIYGASCVNLGIPKDILASSFGKCSKQGPADKYKPEDIMKSLLVAITINTGQLIGLYSSLEKITNILVSSWKIQSEEFNFCLQSTIAFYSKNECKAHFIKDSDYLSCVGDLL